MPPPPVPSHDAGPRRTFRAAGRLRPFQKEAALDIRGVISSLHVTLPNALFALGAAVASFIIIHGALVLIRRRLSKLKEERAHRPIAEVLKQTLARTSNLAIGATALLIGLSVLDLPAPWDERVRHLWFITLGAQVALWLHRAVAVTARRYFRLHGHGSEDEQVTVAHTLVIWVLRTSVWTIFALAMLSNLGINVTTFIASLGIGGVAIALAVQNILGDLFASLAIAVDKPFEVGDFLTVNDIAGSVEHVGLKTTRIRAVTGEQIVIANAEILRNTVHNFKRMQSRHVQFGLRINPSTPPELAAKVPPELKRIVTSKDKVNFERAHVKTLDQNFIEFEVAYMMTTADFFLFLDTQQEVILEAMQMFIELGISTSVAPQQMLVQDGAAGGALRGGGNVRSLH
jgi:small-conductance mechanosensitive channel